MAQHYPYESDSVGGLKAADDHMHFISIIIFSAGILHVGIVGVLYYGRRQSTPFVDIDPTLRSCFMLVTAKLDLSNVCFKRKLLPPPHYQPYFKLRLLKGNVS